MCSLVEIHLRKVTIEEKSVLWKLMQLYLYDLSEFSGDELKKGGEFEYQYFEYYWIEETRHPYFIEVDGNLAGFVLVSDYVVTENAQHSIAEFFILRQFRGKELGKLVAHRIFSQTPGVWEIRALIKNTPAIEFWNRVINEYTNNSYQYFQEGIEAWNGPIWVFDNTQSGSRGHY